MDCSCDLDDDYDPYGFSAEKHVKACKQHICYECGSTIDPGERYLRSVVKFDGKFNVYRWCEACEESFHKLPESSCVRYGELWAYQGL